MIEKEKLNFRQATYEDLDHVLQLLQQAAKWLQTKNTTQWDYYIHDLDGNKAEVIESIENGTTYIVEKEGKVIASVTLEDSPNEWDCDIWGDKAHDSDVVYLHRIVVHRDLKGRNIGETLMEWAKGYVKEQQKKYVRFDCLASNKGLNDYYQRNYELVGIASIYGQHSKYQISV
ncbi:GNAT family N-acetyltransferase [Ornithinibacillus caprae]|nr:GNAT family N-acetyltransferase [Ornithinibacillus caprae]